MNICSRCFSYNCDMSHVSKLECQFSSSRQLPAKPSMYVVKKSKLEPNVFEWKCHLAAGGREGAESGGGGRHISGVGWRGGRAVLGGRGGRRQPGEEAGGPGQPGHHRRAPDEHPAAPERDVLEADADLRERQRLDAVEAGNRQELLHHNLLRRSGRVLRGGLDGTWIR